MSNYKTMTDAEIGKRIHELSNILNGACTSEVWNKAYDEYCQLRNEQHERYRAANQEAFDAFYNKFIKGKTWAEINPDNWEFYSDWHKDMYGYRPRII